MSDLDWRHERLHRLVLIVPLAWAVWKYALGIFFLLFSGSQSFIYYIVGGLTIVLPMAVFAAPIVFLLRGQRAVARWRLVLFGGAALTIFYAVYWVLMSTAAYGFWWWGFPTEEIMLGAYVTLLGFWQMRLSRAQAVRE